MCIIVSSTEKVEKGGRIYFIIVRDPPLHCNGSVLFEEKLFLFYIVLLHHCPVTLSRK